MAELRTALMKDGLTGAERAAVVLLELGEDVAAAVMRHMDEHAIGSISAAMLSIRRVAADESTAIMNNFAAELGYVGGDGIGYLQKILSGALGDSKAREIVESLKRKSHSHFTFNADPRILAMNLANERPQTLALLLAQLPHETGAAMLSFLPEELVAETVYLFTTLDTVSPHAVAELKSMVAELMAGAENAGKRLDNLGGAKHTADILNHLQSVMSENVMRRIEDRDSVIAGRIRENLFTFYDLIKLSDRALQIILREIQPDRLAPALRLSDEVVRERFFQNVSARTAEIIREELQNGPPMRKADALAAQSEVVETALRLAGEGKISINASEELV